MLSRSLLPGNLLLGTPTHLFTTEQYAPLPAILYNDANRPIYSLIAN
jgi:hypothetical protein